MHEGDLWFSTPHISIPYLRLRIAKAAEVGETVSILCKLRLEMLQCLPEHLVVTLQLSARVGPKLVEVPSVGKKSPKPSNLSPVKGLKAQIDNVRGR